ncbi:hypothetical protein [uncultured Butyricimonas sp.]|uniref:hypothetical protein n=1 Tax=uncultured Butyricimonas sp. TaxID=1268785 RepID=UPI0026DC9B05|nr:hypothetical protein [uncultured Butyricimonas sp.]
MKTFRRSFWKTSTFKFGLLPGYVFLLLLGGYLLYDVEMSLVECIYIIVICIVGFVGIIMRCFYLILTDDKLLIKNVFFPFWYKEFYYCDIKKVHIEQPGVIGFCYIQVIVQDKIRHNRKYILDFVDTKDYRQLIPMLEEKGVDVETKNLIHLL